MPVDRAGILVYQLPNEDVYEVLIISEIEWAGGVDIPFPSGWVGGVVVGGRGVTGTVVDGVCGIADSMSTPTMTAGGTGGKLLI